MLKDNMENHLVPTRIQEARESCGFTLVDLSEKIDVTPQAISNYEKGKTGISDGVLNKISYATDFGMSFFYKQQLPLNTFTNKGFYRSNKNVSQKVKKSAELRIKWLAELRNKLTEYIEDIEPNLLDNTSDIDIIDSLSIDDDTIEMIATDLRSLWKIDDAPIVDVVGLLENNGVVITAVESDSFVDFKGIDAYSEWYNGKPYILYSISNKNGDYNKIFNIAHELGHIVLHSNINVEVFNNSKNIDIADKQADYFAQCFLLPTRAFLNKEITSSINSLDSIRNKWNVPFSSIVYRIEALDLLSKNQIQYLKSQLTMKKIWRNDGIVLNDALKKPSIIASSIELIVDNFLMSIFDVYDYMGISTNRLSQLTSLPIEYFDDKLSHIRTKPILSILKGGKSMGV